MTSRRSISASTRRCSGSPAGVAYNTEVERRFLTTHFPIRALSEDTVGCGVDVLTSDARDRPADDESPLAETDTSVRRYDDFQPLPAHITERGAMFRRRHRLHGQLALYGGRIDPGKGCEELIEYFSGYIAEGGDASLVLMGVKLMKLPDEPFIRFQGLLSERERLQALEAATVVVVPSPYESLSLLALEGVRRRNADPRQRQKRCARRALRSQQRRPLLRGSR